MADDLVLLEEESVTSESLSRLENRIVAVVASDGGGSYGFLKRMGAALEPGTRILEKIGLLGSSIPILVERDEDGSERGRLRLERLWRVQGFIRSEILSK